MIVRGHGLAAEGAAFTDTADWTTSSPRRWYRVRANGVGGTGHGLCSCGASSPLLPSATARRDWHRKHKAGIYYGVEVP